MLFRSRHLGIFTRAGVEEFQDDNHILGAADAVEFVIPPTIRFKGQPGEQATMFFRDPSGNALEFKAMADPAKLFSRD